MYKELHRFLILLILLGSRGGWSLRLAKLVVPQYKMRGEIAILHCNYELEGDILYSVKWYKENEEFYRFVPKSNPTQVSYKVEGIKVDHLLSNSRQVVLRSVNLKSSGVYKCEVSAEAPSFSSVNKEAKMEVIFLPNNGPHIKGLLKEYVIGDEISLNCTSSKSYPAALLHWYINDKLVTESDALEKYPNIDHPHGLKTSILGLKIIVHPQHFSQGIMRLRCVASLSPILWQGNQESVVHSMAPHFLDKEALILVRGKAWKITSNLILMLTILLIFFT